MSIENEINRISTNVEETLNAIEEMGGEVPANATSNDMAAAVLTIPVGAKIDDTTPSTETTYSSNRIDELLNEQKEAIDDLKKVNGLLTVETITVGEGGEGPDEPDTPEVTLSSISVTYSGGDVTVGTSLDDLTDIIVTAHYSDGSTATVTDYTLYGEIKEGSNTITVSYGGKTTTFTVTGIAESGGDAGGTVYFYTMDIAKKHVKLADGSLVDDNGAFNVTIPYSDGMTVSTSQHAGWTGGYPPFVIKTNDGKYSKPDYSEAAGGVGIGTRYVTTLTGYAADTVVYANIWIKDTTMDTIKTALETHKDVFYYIGGE